MSRCQMVHAVSAFWASACKGFSVACARWTPSSGDGRRMWCRPDQKGGNWRRCITNIGQGSPTSGKRGEKASWPWMHYLDSDSAREGEIMRKTSREGVYLLGSVVV